MSDDKYRHVDHHESGSEEGSDGEFDPDDLKAQREDKEAHDFIVGQQDYDPDSYFNWKPWLRSKWIGFKKNRKINFHMYQIKFPEKTLDEASEVLLNLCRYRTIDIFDVIELLELGASPNYRPKSKKHHRPDSARDDLNKTKHDRGMPQDSYSNGASALHWCARRGHTHVLWALLQPQVGADVNITDNRNTTPLMAACDSKSSAQVYFVRELLKHPKIRVNVRDSGGNTALLNAIYKNNVWVVRELLMFSPQTGVPAISVLERQEAEDPHAYEIAQYIFAAGLLLQPVELDRYLLEPALRSWKVGTTWQRMQAVLYYLFSLKGRYEYQVVLWLQTVYCYDAELVLRMVQRRSYFEGRRPQELRRRQLDADDLRELADLENGEEVNLEDDSADRKIVNDRHKALLDKYYKPKLLRPRAKAAAEIRAENLKKQMDRRLKMNIERGQTRTARELELWNKRRKNNALKVNEDFDHRLRGQKSAPGVDNFAKIGDDEKPQGKGKGPGPDGDKDEKPRRGSYKHPKYFNYEDEKHVRSKEWVRNQAEGSKGDWHIQPRVRKAIFSNVPDLPSAHMPKEIRLDKHNREKYQRTHEGENVFADDEEEETDSEDERRPVGPHEWKTATKNEHNRRALHEELLRANPGHFDPEREDPADERSPVKHRLNAKPMVSLTKSLQLAREIRTKGTSDGVPVPTMSKAEVSKATRPASSADYSATVAPAAPVAPLFPDDSAPAVVTGPAVPVKSFALSPKRMVRTDIGYVDTTSGYGRYNLGNIDRTVTLAEMNERNFENDDGYDDEEYEEKAKAKALLGKKG